MALSFLKSKSKIDKVTAWDGIASYYGLYFNVFGNEVVISWESSSTKSLDHLDDIIKESAFDTWSKAVNGYVRKAEQRITYTKKSDGTVEISPNEKHKRFFQ